MIITCVFRLTEGQRDGLSVDQVNKDLKNLAEQAKSTKYRDVMKLLRLVLSGLQVLIRVVLWDWSSLCLAELKDLT